MPKMVIKSVEELDRSRKKLRKILFFSSLPILALIIFFAVKTSIIYISAGQVISYTNDGNYEKAVEAAQAQQENSFVDVWLAEYNIGTTRYNTKEYSVAASAFERALTYNPPMPYLCYIHNGLSKSYEKLGDQSKVNGKSLEAEQYYLLGKQTIEQAPLECFPPDPSEGESEGEEAQPEPSEEQKQGEEMQETSKRLDEKLGQEQPDPNANGDEGEADLTDEGKRDQVQEQMDQGNKDVQDDENGNGGGGQEPADKPW